MIAIFKRDFKSYMHSFIGPLFIAIILGMFTIFFTLFNLMGLSNNINGALYNLGYWGLMFLIPIMCMRAFSEERKNKTDQLILTAPVSVFGIVMGKFLAIAAILAIPTAVFCVIPIVMSKFGEVPLLWNYASILGFFLYGLMLIAICIFISNLSDSPIICAVISIFTILLCNLSRNFYDSSSSELVKNIFESTIDFSTRLTKMMMGNLDLTSVIYFVSVTVLFLLLTVQMIQKRRYKVSKKNFSLTAFSTLTVIVLIAAVVGANILALQIPDNIREADVTSQNIYTLSAESKAIAESITDDITLNFFAQENDDSAETKDEAIERILQQYAACNKHITLKYIDPKLNSQVAKNYTDDDVAYSSVIVVNETNGRSRVVNYNDMYETTMDYTTYSSKVTGYDTEGEITYALQYVCLSDDQLTKAYSITGHNEISFESKFSDVIDKNNMQVSELSLLTSEKVPEDCKLLILNTPFRDYTQDEVQKVIDYLDNGGNALIITYYKTYEPLENFAQILNYYGVKVEDGVIIEKDPERTIAGSDPYYILPIIGSDTITSGISQEGYGTVFTPLCQPLSYTEDEKVTVTELLKSSDQAYVQYMDAEDHVSDNGTFLIGLKATKELDSGSSTAVIYSSGDMFSDGANEIVGGNNLRLFSGTLNSLVTFDTELVMIPSKLADSPLSITGKVAIAILAIMFAVAATLIIVGLVVFIVRRRK